MVDTSIRGQSKHFHHVVQLSIVQLMEHVSSEMTVLTREIVPGLFSVIIPCYNRQNLIITALDSVKEQSYRPIEIIIVDDGSTDESRDVICRWSETNAEIDRLVVRCIHQENAGAAAARNRGLNEIRGEFVQYLDSDDFLHRDRLARLAQTFEETRCDFIQTGFAGVSEDGLVVLHEHFGRVKHDLVSQALMGVLWANTLRSSYRRTLIDRIGLWNTTMPCFEDREYVERALLLAAKPMAIRDILASARRGGGERVSDRQRTREGRTFRNLCEKHLAEGIRHRRDISINAKQEFASRMYGLAIRSYSSGWHDEAAQSAKIADSIGVALDFKGRVRRLCYRMRKVGVFSYLWVAEWKSHLTGAES